HHPDRLFDAALRQLLGAGDVQPGIRRADMTGVIDLNKLVGGMSELLRRTLGEHIRIETVLDGGLWPSFADLSQLEN
ncbi:hypothetical protein AB9F45_39735, partial [Rhizobium leguminosarum]|uniref:hypothetical protein n=1 Tax=Rhizobium leguminosarum TaxID=384 RepID=UPI003F9D0D76